MLFRSIHNTGTIAVNSTGDATDLEILVRGATLTGGGHLTLSDNSQNVVFGGDPSAVLDNADNTISGAGQLGGGALTLHNEGVIDADGTNARSAVTGGGAAEIAGASSIEFGAASDAKVSFDAGATGRLTLDHSGGFSGTVGGFTGYDAIDLADIAGGAGATLGYAANADNTGGTLTLSDGTHIANLALLGQYAAADFATAADAGGGTLVTLADPTQNHALIAPGG